MGLFTDSKDFATCYPALESVDWSMVQPSVELTEASIIRDEVLGVTLYNALVAAFAATNASPVVPLPSKFQVLLPLVKRALAYLAAHQVMPSLNMTFTSGGAIEPVTENQQRARQWVVSDSLAQMLATGYGYVDQVVALLYDNIPTYTEWTDAPMYVESQESLLPRLRDANRHMRLSTAWLLHQLRPALRSQQGEVRKIMGDTAYTALLLRLQTNALTTDDKALLDEARPAILSGALAAEINNLSLTVDKRGAWTESSSSSSSGSNSTRFASTDNSKDAKIRDLQQRSRSHFAALNELVNPTTSASTPPSTDTSIFGF